MERPDNIYFHLNNGGICFEVDEEKYSSTLKVDASHMGHKTNSMELLLSKEHLKVLGEYLIRKSEEVKDEKPYCEIPFIYTKDGDNQSCSVYEEEFDYEDKKLGITKQNTVEKAGKN